MELILKLVCKEQSCMPIKVFDFARQGIGGSAVVHRITVPPCCSTVYAYQLLHILFPHLTFRRYGN